MAGLAAAAPYAICVRLAALLSSGPTDPVRLAPLRLVTICAGGLAIALAGPVALTVLPTPLQPPPGMLAMVVAAAILRTQASAGRLGPLLGAALAGAAVPALGLTGAAVVSMIAAAAWAMMQGDTSPARWRVAAIAALVFWAANAEPQLSPTSGIMLDMGWAGVFLSLATFTFDRADRSWAFTQLGERLSGLGRPWHRRTTLPQSNVPGTPVVLISYYFPPQNEVGAARPYRFARYLCRMGVPVAVICSSYRLRRAEDQQRIRTSPDLVADRVPGPASTPAAIRLGAWLHAIERAVAPYDDRLGWLPHAYVAGRRALTAQSVIVSTHPQLVAHLAALALKLRYGRPWIADFRDPLWGNPHRTALRATLLDPIWERLIVTLADGVVANTDSCAALLRARYPEHGWKLHTIWNGMDPERALLPRPIQHRPCRTICHIGTLYGARTPAPVAHALQRLMQGGGVARGTWQVRQIGRIEPGAFDEHGLGPLIAMGGLQHSPHHLPQDLAHDEMLAADLLLLLDMNDTNPGLQVPAKLFEYVQTGRPILALTPPGSATEYVLARSGVTHTCLDPAASPAEFDAALLRILQAKGPARLPTAQFLHEFGAEEQTRRLAALITAAAAPAVAAGVTSENRAYWQGMVQEG